MKAEAKRIADLERQKLEEKQAAERALEREKQKLAEERRQTELKKQQVIAEQKRQEDAKKKAVEAEKQKKLADDKAAKQKAADLAKKAAADKAATELATKQAEQNKQAAAKLAADNATKSAANQVEALAEIERYKAMVRQQIMRYWVVQKGLNQQDATKLFVRVAPTGTVLDVKVTGSSGSDALDRSAVAAVYKASPLPVPKDPELFREFRELRLTLRPDSILSDN
jgi:colicin import membrane protein